MCLRNRIIAILLFPVLTFLFIIGWILYVVEKQQTSAKKMSQRKPNGATRNAKSIEEDDVEMGLIEDLTEEQLISE